MDKFKKQNYKPEKGFGREQRAYLEDKITKIMLDLHYIENESKKIKLYILDFLEEVRKLKGTKNV